VPEHDGRVREADRRDHEAQRRQRGEGEQRQAVFGSHVPSSLRVDDPREIRDTKRHEKGRTASI
jgi:hypothetical protein